MQWRKLTAFSLAVLLLAGCASGGGKGAQSTKGPIVIGAAIGLTGFINTLDVPMLNGAQAAVAKINKGGGVLGRQLKIITADTHSSIDQSGTAAKELLDKGANIILTSCDFDFGGPAAEVAAAARKISMSCASSPKFSLISPLAFTISTAAPTEGAIMAEWAYQSKGLRKAYVLVDTTVDFEKSVCAGFIARWKQLAGPAGLLGVDTFLNTDTSIASQITRMKSLSQSPDVLMMCSYPPGMPVALRQIRAAGINIPVLGTEDYDGTYWHSAVPNLSNVYYADYGSIFGDDPNTTINNLFHQIKTTTGKPPETAYAVQGYSEIQALAKAVEMAGSTNASAVRNALERFRAVQTLDGPTTFTTKWHINWLRPMRIIGIINGKNRFITVWTPKSVPYIVNANP